MLVVHCVGDASDDVKHGKIYDHSKKLGATSSDTAPLPLPKVSGASADWEMSRNIVEVVEICLDSWAVCERSTNPLHEPDEHDWY